MAPSKKSTITPKNRGKRTRQKRTNVVDGARLGDQVEEMQGIYEEERRVSVPLAGELEQANIDSSAIAEAARSTNEAAGLEEATSVRDELERERRRNAELQRQIEEMARNVNQSSQGQNTDSKPIPRPRGTAGADFSLQEAMGLSGNTKKYETYKAIQYNGELIGVLQRNLRDLAMNARINWEVPWAQVPARDKARLFEVARDQHPFLARFERDWATEEIVKQFLKNKRKNHYANGWLEVPEKYAYLKRNSKKRNPTAPRTKRALGEMRRAGEMSTT